MSTTSPPVHDPLPERLTTGYTCFRNGRFNDERERYRHLAEQGQSPPVLLIGCCDSRVSPEVIFDAGPGELFVVRNVAALVPPFDPDAQYQETAAAIEYAVLALRVAHIVVMGHAQCGGIRAFAQGQEDTFKPLSEADFIANWKQLIKPASERIGPRLGDFDDYCETLSHASIIQGIANLRTYPWIKAREDDGALTLHGASFGVANGELTVLDQSKGTFEPIVPEHR